MKRVLWAVLLMALPIFVSAQTITTTSSSVTIQFGQPLFCAAKYTAPNVQLYCFTSSTGHTWDLLIENEVIPIAGGLASWERIVVTKALYSTHWLLFVDPNTHLPTWAMSYGTPTINNKSGGTGSFK